MQWKDLAVHSIGSNPGIRESLNYEKHITRYVKLSGSVTADSYLFEYI